MDNYNDDNYLPTSEAATNEAAEETTPEPAVTTSESTMTDDDPTHENDLPEATHHEDEEPLEDTHHENAPLDEEPEMTHDETYTDEEDSPSLRATEQIRSMMQEAIDAEDFERAAFLRDQLRNIEKVQLDTMHDPFLEFALSQGTEIRFNAPGLLVFDINLIEISLRNAINRTKSPRIAEKLNDLLESGTEAEKASFVLGTGDFYFPVDLGQMALRARESQGSAEYTFEHVCFTVCESQEDGTQDCYDKCRKVIDLLY